jgi:hypothetical protein
VSLVLVLVRCRVAIDDATGRRCLDALTTDPARAAAFAGAWVEAKGAVDPWLRAALDASPEILRAAGPDLALKLHRMSPTPASWRVLTLIPRGPNWIGHLVPETYGNRADLALATLASAVHEEADELTRSLLGRWLVILFSGIPGQGTPASPAPTEARELVHLSDRDLRKILGPRMFLRGLDLDRRGTVTLDAHDGTSASGRVDGRDVTFRLGPDGLSGSCPCTPPGAHPEQPCRHVAALLIVTRAALRSNIPR